jgi:hypothetical protein
VRRGLLEAGGCQEELRYKWLMGEDREGESRGEKEGMKDM